MAAIYILIIVLIVLLAFLSSEGYKNKTVVRQRTIYYHYTEWCPACKHYRKTWDEFAKVAAAQGVACQMIDEEKAKTDGIVEYPTIRMINEYGRTSQYHGVISVDNLVMWALT